jgi:hypothetical protein
VTIDPVTVDSAPEVSVEAGLHAGGELTSVGLQEEREPSPRGGAAEGGGEGKVVGSAPLLPGLEGIEGEEPIEAQLRRVLEALRPDGRDAREVAKEERTRALREQRAFLRKRLPLLPRVLASGEEVDPWQIEPELVLAESQEEKDLVRLLLLAWWSMPPTRAYGRRFTFLVKDKQNGKVMGLVSLMSPLLGMEARDRYLGVTRENRTLAANLGLNGHRVGALPPYNELLGGKLAAMVLASREVREVYEERYRDRVTLMERRALPPKLLYVYTTGAYGRASIYERLRDREGNPLAVRVGETKGEGVLHVSDAVHDLVARFLESRGRRAKRGYGGGPSQRLRHVKEACKLLGIPEVTAHGHRRAIYLFPHAANLREALAGEEPRYTDRPFAELAIWWKERWAVPRALRALRGEVADWRAFSPEGLVREVEEVLEAEGERGFVLLSPLFP